MKKMQLTETFDGTTAISLVEEPLHEDVAPSRVDGKYIIGMIEGQFFQPDGMSRNKRWYPRSLWEKALNGSDVKNRFLTSTMFGEIGHSEGPVEDMTLRNGCASHFVDKMWIDEKGRGMGRAYILNTPTGNLLKTYLGAGCKLKVSTRGEGLYLEDETHDGCPVVDPNSYDLQTADFVINPGFLETSAVLKEQYENIDKEINKNTKTIQETIAHVTKEGENRMTLDMEAYVRELKEELKSLKDENKTLNEELKAKDRELLQNQVTESAEVKKLNEAYAPFKKMNVSAKTLTETFKRSQKALKTARAEKAKIQEELNAYKDKCGSLENIDEATKLSAKSLAMISEYKKLGSVKELKAVLESAKRILPKLKEAKRNEATLQEAERLGKNVVKVMDHLKESKRLEKNSVKMLNALKESKKLEALAEKATKVIAEYKNTVGTLAEAKELVESAKKVVASKKAQSRKVAVKEALEISKKYGCTVESAAKLIRKHGSNRASQLLEQAISKKTAKNYTRKGMVESKKLIEDASNLDKKPKIEAEKTAKDFLSTGMIKNFFNTAAYGKEFTVQDINKVSDNKTNAAKELLKKYSGAFETDKTKVNVEKEKSAGEAEAIAQKLIKKA